MLVSRNQTRERLAEGKRDKQGSTHMLKSRDREVRKQKENKGVALTSWQAETESKRGLQTGNKMDMEWHSQPVNRDSMWVRGQQTVNGTTRDGTHHILASRVRERIASNGTNKGSTHILTSRDRVKERWADRKSTSKIDIIHTSYKQRQKTDLGDKEISRWR